MADIQKGNELVNIDVFAKIGLAEGMKVGDLGCGNLAFYAINAAKRVGKSGVVYAVDILKNALNAVDNKAKQEGLDNIRTLWSNLELYGATPIPDAELDIIFIHNVLFQSFEHGQFLKEASRLMKAGGKMMIIDWKLAGATFGPPLKDRPDPEVVKSLAVEANLALQEEFEAGPYHWGMIFKRV